MKLFVLHTFPFFGFHRKNEIQTIPDPLPRQDVQEVPQPPKEDLRILCSTFSNDEKFVAFADDHKQLTLWEWQDNAGLKFVKQWNLVRRANKITFDKNDQNILVAGMYTVWKFHTFAITQILREINLWNSRGAKSAILIHLEAQEFDFYEFLHFLKAEIYQIHKITVSKMAKNNSFCTSRIHKIDFT